MSHNNTIDVENHGFEASRRYANQLLLHANSGAAHPGTPPYGYLEWALVRNDRAIAPIPSNWKGTAYEEFFKAYDQFMAAVKGRVGGRPESDVRRRVGVGLTEYTEEGNG